MFCPECGTKNADDVVFCENCGIKLVDSKIEETTNVAPTPQFQQTSASQKQPVSKKKMIIIGEIILLIALLFGWYSMAKKVTAPEHIATIYFESVMSGDWEKVFDTVEFPKSEFLTDNQFFTLYASKQPQEITNFNVKSGNIVLGDNSNLTTPVTVEYRLQGNSNLDYYNIELLKGAEKSLLFFPKWEVSPTELISTGFRLYIPVDASVSVDGVTLSDKYLDTQVTAFPGYTSYLIPWLFTGTHQINIVAENYEDYETSFDISEDNMEFRCDEMTFKDTINVQLIEHAGDALKKIYEAGIAEKPFLEIKDLFSSDSTVQSAMETSYNNFVNHLTHDDGLGIVHLSLSNFQGDNTVRQNDGILTANVSLNYHFDYTYNFKNFWSGDIGQENHTGSSTSVFTFIFKDNKWTLTSTDFDSVYRTY